MNSKLQNGRFSEKDLKGHSGDTVREYVAFRAHGHVFLTLRRLDNPRKDVYHAYRKARATHLKPLVTFIFHCSSRGKLILIATGHLPNSAQDALQKLGIIERQRSPTPLEDKDPESLSPERLLLFARRHMEISRSSEVRVKVQSSIKGVTN